MLEIKNTATEKKNAFDGLISRLVAEEIHLICVIDVTSRNRPG